MTMNVVAEVRPQAILAVIEQLRTARRTGTLVFDVKLGKILHGKFQETEHLVLDKKDGADS